MNAGVSDSLTRSVRQVDDRRALISYADHVEHRGQRHTHRCQQRVTVDREGLICHIEHMDLPGEKESLATFFEKVGIRRDTE